MNLWIPKLKKLAPWTSRPTHICGRVVALLRDADGNVRKRMECENIVTNDGDLYYAERGALLTTGTPIGPVPTNFTDANGVPDMIMELYTATGSSAPGKTNNRSNLGTLLTNSGQAIDATYPLVNDADGDNTGAGVDIITYRVSYTTANANGSDIDDIILTNPSPGASEVLISHATLAAPFTKTSSDTLKVFVNHEMLGV